MEPKGLKYLLNANGTHFHNDVIDEERLTSQLNNLRHLISFFREYPDLMIDFIKGPNCKFKFMTYQRILMRVFMRHRHTYCTLPRAAGKSFIAMLILFVKAVLYPGVHIFISTGGKEQAASITVAKILEICRLIPVLDNELDHTRGQTKTTKDDAKFIFKNGSIIDILVASERSRGQRRNAGLLEECILIDGDMLNDVLIPTMNVDRLLPDGTRDPKEIINKNMNFITTAGWIYIMPWINRSNCWKTKVFSYVNQQRSH